MILQVALLFSNLFLNETFLSLWAVGAAFNIGIFHWRPTDSAKKLAKEWKELLLADDKIWDQNGFNDLVRRQLGPSVDDDTGLVYAYDGNLKLGLLPASLFCSGHTYFVQVRPLGWFLDICFMAAPRRSFSLILCIYENSVALPDNLILMICYALSSCQLWECLAWFRTFSRINTVQISEHFLIPCVVLVGNVSTTQIGAVCRAYHIPIFRY